VSQLTDPPVTRKNKGESDEDFEERKTERQQSIQRAKDILNQINLDKKQLRALLRKEAILRSKQKREPLKWRGDYRSEYGKRLVRINKFN